MGLHRPRLAFAPFAIALASACIATGERAPLVDGAPAPRPQSTPALSVSAPFARGPNAHGCGYLDPSPTGPAVSEGPLFDRVASAMLLSPEEAVVDWVQPARSPQALDSAAMVIAHWSGGLRWCLVSKTDLHDVVCDRQGQVGSVVPHGDRMAAARIAALMDHAVRVIPDARSVRLCTPAPAWVREQVVAPTLYWADDGRRLTFVEQVEPSATLARLVRVDISLNRQPSRRQELFAWNPEDHW